VFLGAVRSQERSPVSGVRRGVRSQESGLRSPVRSHDSRWTDTSEAAGLACCWGGTAAAPCVARIMGGHVGFFNVVQHHELRPRGIPIVAWSHLGRWVGRAVPAV